MPDPGCCNLAKSLTKSSIMKYLLFVITAFILSGCCCCPGGTDSLPEESPPLCKKIDSEEFSWIAEELAVKWGKELFLTVENSCVFYGNNVHTIRFELTSMSILNIKKARELLVDVVEDILDKVNRSPIVATELQSYPLTPENLEIYVDFLSFYNLYVDPYKVGFITLENGEAKYWASDVKDEQLYSWHYRIEPYFRSREIVQLSRAAERNYEEEHSDDSFDVVRGVLRPQKYYKTK